MSKPFDATLKTLLELSPGDWPVLLGLPAGVTRVVDADTSTVSGAADKVLHVTGPPDWLLHLEFQTGPDPSLPRRMHLDNAVLEDRHDLPVLSAAVLLAPRANLKVLNGLYEQQFAGERYLSFQYRVIRIWELPVQPLLTGGLGLLPLACICEVEQPELPGVIERVKERVATVPRAEAARLWTAAYVLLGLRHSIELAERLLQGVIAMEDSVTYQAIVGKAERKLLLRQGTKRFGAPTAEALTAFNAITAPAQLEDLGDRLLDVGSWEELLQMPGTEG